MNRYGFLRVAAAVPVVKLADVESNKDEILAIADKAEAAGVSVLVFPELCLTGASCGDLFGQQILIEAVNKALDDLKSYSRGKLMTLVVGAPLVLGDRLYNCAVVIRNGQLVGAVPKGSVPSVGDGAQSRWFSDGDALIGKNAVLEGTSVPIHPHQIFSVDGAQLAFGFGENSSGAQICFQLSAENDHMFKNARLKQQLAVVSRKEHIAYVYCGAGRGESTQDLVFSGTTLIYEDGNLVKEGKRFQTGPQLLVADIDVEKLKNLRRMAGETCCGEVLKQNLGEAARVDIEKDFQGRLDPFPFIPAKEGPAGIEEEAVGMQVAGLASRLQHIGHPKVIVGVSGGLDSTLALLVCALAFDQLGWDRKGILGVTMPGFGTSGRTYNNALDFMTGLGITQKEISIVPAVTQHFHDIGQDIQVHDVTYENSQARERTQILMDIANKEGGIVLGTGDLSELALGWATYNGDHMSMYGVNASVPKTLVRHLVRWIAGHLFLEDKVGDRSMAEILMDVVDTPVSPELTPADEDGKIAQKTEDIVGPYELHDFFLYQYCQYGFGPRKIYFLACHAFDGKEGRPYYGEAVIKKFLRKFYWRFFTQQFKRSCLPDGPKVTEISLSPRGGYVMPSDAKVKLFIDELDQLGE